MVWDAFIATYLFLAGLGAGAFVLGALAGWAKTPARKMQKIGIVLGPIAVAVGTLLLVFDAQAGLANPGRFFLLITNLNSVMAWGVIILSLFIVVAAIDAVVLLVKKATPKALDAVGMVLALCVAAYTGVLLGDASMAFPLWHPLVLPALFVVSAASTGFAAVQLIAHFAAADEAHALPFLSKTGIAFPVLEALLVVALLGVTATVTGPGAAAATASLAMLTTGSYAVVFWLGLVLVGLVLPFALELVRASRAKATDGKSPVALAATADLGVLVGGFLLRFLVIMAAVPLALG